MSRLILNNGYISINPEINSYLIKNNNRMVDHTEAKELWEILTDTSCTADVQLNEELEGVAIFYFHFQDEDNSDYITHEGVTRSIIGTTKMGKDNPKYETLRFIAKTGMTATIESIDKGIIFINGATKED